MNKHLDNFSVDKTKQNIDNFLNTFSNIISFDVNLKLQISKLYLSGFTTPQIKKQELLTKKYPPKSKESKILSLYLQPDCNKLYRIRNNSNPEGIIKMIQLQNLCTYILQKYPSPDLAGFPFSNWTPYQLKLYICQLFGAKRNRINKKTISNILSTIYNSKENMPKENLQINFSPMRYYLYIRRCKLKLGSYRGKRKYNYCIYAALFQLSGTDFIYTGRSMSKLYFARKKKRQHNPPTLYRILEQLLPNNKNGSENTIYIEDSSLKTFRNRSLHSLEALPNYRFILFKFDYIKNIEKEKKIPKETITNDMEALERQRKLVQELDKISFSHPSQKKEFLEKMSEKLLERER